MLLVTLGVALAVATPVQAAHMAVRDDKKIPLAIQGKPLQSLQEAMKVFAAEGDNFYIWCTERSGVPSCIDVLEAGKITNIRLSRTLIDLTCVYPSESISLDVGQIASVELYQFPSLDGAFPYALKIARRGGEGGSDANWFRVRNVEAASALANAFRSLPSLIGGDIAPPPPAPVQLGISARDLTPGEAGQAGATGGVFVAGVDTGSLAEGMDIRKGDYLLEVDGAKVAGLEALKLQLSTGKMTSAVVWRNGKTMTLTVLSKL